MTTIVFQVQSFLIVMLFIYGVTQTSKRLRHIKIMSSGIAWDLLLILQIELTRSAIGKAAGAMVTTKHPMFYIHLFFAVLTVIMYIFVAISGRKIYLGITKEKSLHKKLGLFTLATRIITLITSFFVIA